MPPLPNLADIIHDDIYTQKTASYRGNHPRMEDVLALIDWDLARDPKQGTDIGECCRVYKTTPIHRTPSFWVLYSYNEAAHEVTLLSLEAVKVPTEL